MIYQEPTISSTTHFEGYVFNVRVDTVKLIDGRTGTREIVEHNGGVGIVAVDDEGNIHMVRQYRRGAGQVLLEIPAGKLEKGEDPELCAVRELEEETGLKCEEIVKLGEFYVSPAYDTEIIHLYLAKNLSPGVAHLDDDENLDVELMKYTDVLKMAKNAEIPDGKTTLAVVMAEKFLKFNDL